MNKHASCWHPPAHPVHAKQAEQCARKFVIDISQIISHILATSPHGFDLFPRLIQPRRFCTCAGDERLMSGSSTGSFKMGMRSKMSNSRHICFHKSVEKMSNSRHFQMSNIRHFSRNVSNIRNKCLYLDIKISDGRSV